MGKLQNKVAVVTGGNSGIGLATAKLYAQEGAQVAITGRRKEVNDTAIADIGKGSIAVQSDASCLSDIDNLYSTIKAQFGKIDVLFLNAGVAKFVPLKDTTEELFDTMMNINLKGLYFSIQKAVPFMRENSSIILTTSIANESGLPNSSVYSATKAAVRSLARTLTPELIQKGIRINALSPGHTNTPIFGKLGLPEDVIAQMAESLVPLIPAGRFGAPEDIAKAALFLASDDSSYMYGTETIVDGGFSQI